MSGEKEETKIVTVYNSESKSASTYLNNPDIDTEAHIVMFCSHVNLVIKNLMLSGMSLPKSTTTVQKAVTIATDRIAKESAEDV